MRATSGPTHVGDVLTLVPHFLDGEADDLQPHLAHVCRAGGAHAVTHHFRFLDDLLDGELPDDSPEMAFHHQANQAFPLSRFLAQELFRGGQDRFLVGLHLDLRHRFDRNGDALFRVKVLLRRHVERHQFEGQIPARLHHRENDGASSAVNVRAAHAVSN